MSKTALCPLCGSLKGIQIDAVEVRQLVQLYKVCHNYDVKDLLGKKSKPICLILCSQCGLKFYSPMTPGDEAFYTHLAAQHDWYYRNEKWEFFVARNNIPKDARVLEAGCGKGAFTTGLACAAYTGLELSASQLPRNDDWRTFMQESVETHARTHIASYDVACSFQVLEHVPGVRSFMNALVQVLKPGGLLMLSVPCEDSYMGTSVNQALNMPPHQMTRWTGAALASLAKIVGLEMVRLLKEPVQDPNCIAASLITGILRAYTGLPPSPLIDMSLRHRGLQESASNLCATMPELVQNLVRGQAQYSYLAVYRKPA